MNNFLKTIYQKFLKIRKSPWSHFFAIFEWLTILFSLLLVSTIGPSKVEYLTPYDGCIAVLLCSAIFSIPLLAVFIGTPFLILMLIRYTFKFLPKIIKFPDFSKYLKPLQENLTTLKEILITKNPLYIFIIKPVLNCIITGYNCLQTTGLILFYIHISIILTIIIIFVILAGIATAVDKISSLFSRMFL